MVPDAMSHSYVQIIAHTTKRKNSFDTSYMHLTTRTVCLYTCSEHSIVAVRASVMVYDDMQKKWLPSGASPGGISKVHIYHHPTNATFRIVGRKVQDHEVRLSKSVNHQTVLWLIVKMSVLFPP